MNKGLDASFPHLSGIRQFHGTIESYYLELIKQIDFSVQPVPEAFSRAFKGLIQECYQYLSEKDISGVLDQLSCSPIISTAEHLAIISHPEQLNVLLDFYNLSSFLNNTYAVSFYCSTVKLDNEIESRKVFFEEFSINVMSSKYKNYPAFLGPTIQINQELERLAGDDFVGKNLGFDSQCSELNYRLSKYFPDKDFRYISLSSELLCKKMILNHQYLEVGSFLHRLIFEEEFRARVVHSLDGVRSFWDLESNSGTVLFWEFSDSKKRLWPVRWENGALIGSDFKLSSADQIIEAIQENKLIPSSSLSLLVWVYEVKLLPFGGIFQVSYLKKAVVCIENEFSEEPWIRCPNRNLVNDAYLHFRSSDLSSKGLSLFETTLKRDQLENHWKADHQESVNGCFEFLEKLVS